VQLQGRWRQAANHLGFSPSEQVLGAAIPQFHRPERIYGDDS
jgi:hypothetical protein